MCTGRVDLAYIMRAFSHGADAVFVGGCWPGECHYLTQGNYDAFSLTHICRRLLEQVGIAPERLRLEWLASSEGMRFAELMNDFSKQMRDLGPIGEAEGMDEDTLALKLKAITQMIPYIKLVESERMRPPVKSEEVYERFFSSEEFDRVFAETLGAKLTISQIMLLLRESSLSTGEIAEALQLTPAEVARYLATSTRQGLVRYDEGRRQYATR